MSPVAGLAPRRGVALTVLAVGLLALAGCGSTKHSKSPVEHRQAGASVRGAGVPAAAIAVIDGWTGALREGHLQRAAEYWAHPSVFINGPNEAGHYTVLRIETNAQALAADEMLPCGATLRSSSLAGVFVKAIFTLAPRPGVASSRSCSGPAAVDFLIRGGLILHWIRAPIAGGSEPEVQAPGTEV